MFLLSKVLFVFADKFDNIVKVFNVIPSIPCRAVAGPADEVLDCIALTFFDSLFIEQAVYFKRLKDVNVTINKDGRWLMWLRAIKGIVGWGKSWFQLCNQEDWVYSLVVQNIQLIYQLAYFFYNLKWVNILLGELFRDSSGGKNGIAFMQSEHSPVTNFHEARLIFLIIMRLLIGEGKGYCISCICTGLKHARNEGSESRSSSLRGEKP